MSKKENQTNADILAEIERLKQSPYVKLGREQMRLKQQLYNLRHLEKIGRAASDANKKG